MLTWLRQAGPPGELEHGLCRHTAEQAFIARSALGGRGVFAARNLAEGEVLHVVRAGHLVGGWLSDDVLSLGAIRRVVRAVRGVGDDVRFAAYVGLLPAYRDLHALPEFWSEAELSWLQDEQIASVARAALPTLAAWHETLRGEEAWQPPLTLDEVHRARALLQSRALSVGSKFYLMPFVDSINTRLVPGDGINVKLKSLRAVGVGVEELAAADSATQPRAVLTAVRAIAAGEELFLDYGVDIRRTSVRYSLLNYGILGNSGTEQFRAESLRWGAEGQLVCEPLWCVENGPTYDGMTAARHVSKFPERLRKLEADLNSPPWNASTMDSDVEELLAARSALQSVAGGGDRPGSDQILLRARRRVVALEYRLGCKLGVVSAIEAMQAVLAKGEA